MIKYQISRKSIDWETSCSEWKDAHTDMKITVASRNFAKGLKMHKNAFMANLCGRQKINISLKIS